MLESVRYTAILIDYIAKLIQCSVASAARSIGRSGIERIYHNAPMSRHLPLDRIAGEVLYDYDLPYRKVQDNVTPDNDFGSQIMSKVGKTSCNHLEYATKLYEQLLSSTR